MMSAPPATHLRQSRYHRRGSLLWQRALRRLVLVCKLTDSRTAELLSQLTDAALRELDRRGWTLDRVEDLAVPGANPLPWTERQVRHHRQAQKLPANHAGTAAARAARQKDRSDRQQREGWWYLLPDADTKAKGWRLWLVECQVLSLLRDRGPMTRRDVLRALAERRREAPHGQSVFSRLIASGLVEVRQGPRGAVFALASAAVEAAAHRQTGTEDCRAGAGETPPSDRRIHTIYRE